LILDFGFWIGKCGFNLALDFKGGKIRKIAAKRNKIGRGFSGFSGLITRI
jgi:hypothetical protein